MLRVHTDAAAGRLAQAAGARAFTLGRNVYFAEGEYQPRTGNGLRLLAHELTHAVQQGVRRAASALGLTLRVSMARGPMIQRTLAATAANFQYGCACGENLGNNCAHYLSDSLIRSGYSADLDGGVGGLYRRYHGRVVCKSGRPVRAAELSAWFASLATQTFAGEPNSTSAWAVYQERASDGQGHVVIHSHAGTSYAAAGTGDYPAWETQNHFTF